MVVPGQEVEFLVVVDVSEVGQHSDSGHAVEMSRTGDGNKYKCMDLLSLEKIQVGVNGCLWGMLGCLEGLGKCKYVNYTLVIYWRN